MSTEVVTFARSASGVRIVSRSSRVLVDEALPEDELERVGAAIDEYGAPEITGYHKLRARTSGRAA